MTSTIDAVQTQRSRRASARSLWADGLEAAIWLTAAAAIALFVYSGGLITFASIDYVYALGRVAGLIAAVLILSQVLLISRSPLIERAVGHDRTTQLHTKMGKIAFILMLVHVAIITAMTAYYEGNSVFYQSRAFWELGWFMPAAQIGFALFAIIVATSLALVRSRWRYETWHAVHVSVYIAIALVVPHQFMEGTTFRNSELAWWFWFSLYAIAFGSLIAFRFIKPVVQLFRYDLRVSSVTSLPDGSTSIEVTGKNLNRLGAKPGQFFLWRFLDKERGRQSHPFSLSREPDDTTMRITVKPVGDMTRDLASVKVGTRVLAEGPLGVFSEVTRTKPGLLLMCAGIGVTPVRSMLEGYDPDEGPCTVVMRVRSLDEAPLLDEVTELAQAKGANLHVLVGPRGEGWTAPDQDQSLSDLVANLEEYDIYICGPEQWAAAVQAEADSAGVPREAIHREQFAW